jgi:DNA-binding response OmpR family regulator
MPGMDGYAVCREMRLDPLLRDIPVLFLTAKIKDEDRVLGFVAGGDDYLVKPFNVDELVLRIRAILRRAQIRQAARDGAPLPEIFEPASPAAYRPLASTDLENGHNLTVGLFRLDTRTFELLTPAHGKVRLTPVQFDLLKHMMSHPGEIFSPARLLDEVWDYPSATGSTDLVRVHIKNLRERIESDPRSPSFIRTVPGYGYTVGSPT